jgi:hypothetical protein
VITKFDGALVKIFDGLARMKLRCPAVLRPRLFPSMMMALCVGLDRYGQFMMDVCVGFRAQAHRRAAFTMRRITLCGRRSSLDYREYLQPRGHTATSR